MKISKRQLERIIKEEYLGLKKQGLIREAQDKSIVIKKLKSYRG